jgi:hypothetical protein
MYRFTKSMQVREYPGRRQAMKYTDPGFNRKVGSAFDENFHDRTA